MYQGIDVSNYNNVDWNRIASDGIAFAYLKATEGVNFVDPTFDRNRRAASAFGIHSGAYHFARPDSRPTISGAQEEARFFCSVVKYVGALELRPVLDLEVSNVLGPAALVAWVGAFMAEVERILGVRPILYTYSSFLRSKLGGASKLLSAYGLWLADYGPNDGREHPALKPYLIHQYTSTGRLSGEIGNLDRDSAESLDPILAHKKKRKVRKALWPVPLPAWFWAWAVWRKQGRKAPRPKDAPRLIPPWAWVRLKAMS